MYTEMQLTYWLTHDLKPNSSMCGYISPVLVVEQKNSMWLTIMLAI
jgi:hypothetical protein